MGRRIVKSTLQYQLEHLLRDLEGAEEKAEMWTKEYVEKGVLSPGNNYAFKHGVFRGTILGSLNVIKEALEYVKEQDDK